MRRSLLLLAALLAGGGASAQSAFPQTLEPIRFGQIDLQAEAAREVDNDTMTATLYAEASDANPAQLATTLNRVANEALAIAREAPATKAVSAGSQTYPVYDPKTPGRLVGWRGRTDIRLEGRDFREIGALVGRLQATLRLAGIAFSVSPELRRRVENELITEAIAAFRTRADIARAALGAGSVRVAKLEVRAMGGAPRPPRPYMEMRAEVSATAMAAPPPQFEGGSSQVQVVVTGLVQTE